MKEIVSLRYYLAHVSTTDTKPIALVTGASSGIGRAAAVALAAHGFDVAINYSSSEKSAQETVRLAEAKGAKTLLIKCDVSDDPGVKKMLASVESTFGRLDALVNNAGITSEIGPKDLDAMTPEEWDRVFAVNVRGMFQVTRAAVPMLKAAMSRRGRWVCNIPGGRALADVMGSPSLRCGGGARGQRLRADRWRGLLGECVRTGRCLALARTST